MKSLFTLICSLFLFNVSNSQETLREYLSTHNYAFTLSGGFDTKTSEILVQKLASSQLVLQAEGGSHFLKIYDQLPLMWLKFLNTNFKTTGFFGEFGHSVSILYNRYLQTGDTSLLVFPRKTFVKNLYAFNQTLPAEQRIFYHGLDFESVRTYIRALQMILPNTTAPSEIITYIDLIKNANPSLADCDYIVGINKKLKKALEEYPSIFNHYFGKNFADFERMVNNGATCKDSRKDRNPNLAANFLSLEKTFNHRMYYAELGLAHTVLAKRVTAASIINHSDEFKNKVCVVNLYCDNCSTAEEGAASNWQLNDIEKDIKTYFLPLCKTDFTLFDLSDDNPAIAKFRSYGQFLIIARNQD